LPSLIALAPEPARAQPARDDPLKEAQSLYDEASRALDHGDYGSACPKLEEVVRLIPQGVGAKLTLAECYEAAGRFASAWVSYKTAEQAAKQADQKERERKAAARAVALEPKIAWLVVSVASPLQSLRGLEILHNGASLGPDRWGVDIPVDNGDHAITARAPGKQPARRVVTARGNGERLSVAIEALADRAAPAPPARAEMAATPPSKAATARRTQHTVALISGGIGLALTGIGSYAGVTALRKKHESDSDGHCDGNLCDAIGVELRNEGLTAGTIATATLIPGAVLLAGSAVFLLLTRAPSPPGQAKLRIGPKGLSATW
jgi:tetratricopeptide (TPR) repeat protein